MLRIRLSRVGAKRQPSYRIVVADVEAKRDGRIVERIGHYDPRAGQGSFTINEGRALHWLSVGAQPSDAVRRLLQKQGTLDRLGRVHKGESVADLVAEFESANAPAEPTRKKGKEKEAKGGILATAVAKVVETVGDALIAAGEAIAGDDVEGDEPQEAEQAAEASAEPEAAPAESDEPAGDVVAEAPAEGDGDAAQATGEGDGEAAAETTEDDAGTPGATAEDEAA
jgi:small subunit ribosomal protein S16